MNKSSGAYVVSWDFSNGPDKDLLIVGERRDGKNVIINAFQGEKAHDIFERITAGKKEGETNE